MIPPTLVACSWNALGCQWRNGRRLLGQFASGASSNFGTKSIVLLAENDPSFVMDMSVLAVMPFGPK